VPRRVAPPRSELGKISLDKTFEEREQLNASIVRVINEASSAWGLQCLRYEIKDIAPPRSISAAMEMQAEAERRKRAQVLDSEGERQAAINRAEGMKQKTILESEAAMLDTTNRAKGDASAILARAEATARSVELLSKSLAAPGGAAAAQLRVAEQYLAAFGNIAKQGTTMLLPSSASEPASMVAQALSIYKSMGVGGGLPGGAGGVQQEHVEPSHAGAVVSEPHAAAVPKLASADEALRSMLRETIDEREAHEGRARFSLQR
jgi:regulator of protease activity HflC (stomatin/prohibitin superfamily)